MFRLLIACLGLYLARPAYLGAEPLKLDKGDSICILGNTLPERMQHDGWLETLILSRFPEHDLTIRNLAFSGDTLTVRLRSAGFGEPDDFLTKFKADVVFAFFGYGESFAGEAGLAQFRTDLEAFIEHTRGQKYNGESAPEIVLFSPIAYQNIGDRNLPDGRGHNVRLEMYAAAMRGVAEQKEVRFVDLFGISQKAYSATDSSLTINGVHLTSQGNRQFAPNLDSALFGARFEPIDWSRLEPLRQAILDKNFYWFHRYRATDGYSTYGGRSYLKFVNDQTNREVMLRELEVLDQMTANRDQRIWAYAKEKESEVDDSNLPPLINVISNKPGDGPDGEHLVVSGKDAIGLMTVHQNMTVNLFADEAQFPELVNPVQMAVDPKGRTWIAVWPTYPHWRPDQEMNDKLLIIEDTDGDGTADRCKTFADKLHNPTGFEFWNGGVLIAMAPDLWFLKDTNGDDVADVRTRILHGLDSADTHHTSNSFTFDPGGNLYFQEGVFHRTQTETPYGIQRNYDACVWRYNPRLQSFERYISYGFANPHGHVFDRWGQGIVHDGTGANPYHDTLISGFIPFPQKHASAPNVYERWTRPCPGTEILSSSHFSPELQGNLLVGNVIGFQGILNYKLRPDGSSLGADELEPIVFSSDPNFRPSDLEIGGDGALYFTDWYNPLIGHMQHNLRDPSRDKRHGRVYRVTYNGRELLKPEPLDQLSIPQLLERLKSSDNRIRYRTRIALSAHPSEDVIAAVRDWISRLDTSDPDYEHHLLEALWVHQHHNVIDESLLGQLLNANDSRARAAAIKVLVVWRDSVPQALELLKAAAGDAESRVRLEAVRGASFFTDPAALEVAIISSEFPSDRFLDYTRNETLKVLEPQWKEAIASGRKVEFTTAAGTRYFLRNIGTNDLLALPRDEAVFRELLQRDGIDEANRLAALKGLAQIQNTTPLQVLLNTIQNIDQTARNESVVFDLVRLLTSWNPGELEQFRSRLIEMATTAGHPIVRQIGYVALMAADNSVEEAWKLATSSVPNLQDFLNAMPLVLDPSFQSALYPRVKLLLNEFPEGVVRREAMNALVSVRGKETESFEAIAKFTLEEGDRLAAMRALQRIPQRDWSKEMAPELANGTLAYLRSIPEADRRTPAAIEALQFAESLAGLLPPAEAAKVRSELGELGVQVVRLATLPHRMSYDQERIVVQAGKTVEFIFENPDLMPHNFVIVEPGSLEEIGLFSEANAQKPEFINAEYVPDLPQVLLASRLVQPRDSQTFTFQTPDKPGVYAYVCTYPGHWRRMYGALYVVANRQEYLASPEEYLKTHPLEIADELLKFARPRKEWTLAELTESLDDLQHGRSFESAKQIFTIANCVACHKLNDVGNEYGPDLAKLDPRWKPEETIRHILEPSWKINEKFQTWIFVTDEGKVVTGMVLEEDDQTVKLIENPLAKTPPITLRKFDVEDRKKSPTSLMPKGLLDRLRREEVLDLLAYVISGGKADHMFFQHHH